MGFGRVRMEALHCLQLTESTLLCGLSPRPGRYDRGSASSGHLITSGLTVILAQPGEAPLVSCDEKTIPL